MTIEVAASTVSFPSEYRRYRLYLKDNAMRTLATFENAYRLASAMSDQTAGAYVIVATRDPDQPHRIEPAAGQPDAIALISADDVPQIWPRASPCRQNGRASWWEGGGQYV